MVNYLVVFILDLLLTFPIPFQSPQGCERGLTAMTGLTTFGAIVPASTTAGVSRQTPSARCLEFPWGHTMM